MYNINYGNPHPYPQPVNPTIQYPTFQTQPQYIQPTYPQPLQAPIYASPTYTPTIQTQIISQPVMTQPIPQQVTTMIPSPTIYTRPMMSPGINKVIKGYLCVCIVMKFNPYCHKCHGTGYKKKGGNFFNCKLLILKGKPCKTCYLSSGICYKCGGCGRTKKGILDL